MYHQALSHPRLQGEGRGGLGDRMGWMEKGPFNECVSIMWGVPLVALYNENLLDWGLYGESTMKVERDRAADGQDFRSNWSGF